MEKVNIAEKFTLFAETWRPYSIAQVQGMRVKVVRVLGEFVWHSHEHEDELFWIIEGSMTIQFRDRDVVLNPGEFLVVPRGVEHRPVAEQEAKVLLLEPASTVNTGEIVEERTRTGDPWL